LTTTAHGRQEDCFLCTLDAHACTIPKLEGRIVSAKERLVKGEMLPSVTLDTGGPLATITLTNYYHSLVKELIALGPTLRRFSMTLRVYHLPSEPVISEYRGQPRLSYSGNTYTLAVLEPDLLLNITDLSQADYCARQYLLQQLIASPPSSASIRGNLVHYCFKELLKEHDRGAIMHGHDARGQETPLAALQRYCEQALEQNSIEMALASVSPEMMREEIAPHLEGLATWFQNQSATLWDMPAEFSGDQDDDTEIQQSGNQVRAETFLLAPEIGLRGRLDLYWQQMGRQRFLELKTGGGNNLPKSGHRSQVLGYHAQLVVRRDPRMKKAMATLLYSGTPREAEAHGIPFNVRNLQRVNETRNLLIFSAVTSIPPTPPGPSRCTKCSMLTQCRQISDLLDWQPPQPLESVDNQYGAVSHPDEEVDGSSPTQARNIGTLQHFTAEDRAFFAKFYRLLHLEGRESERLMALLWQEDVEARFNRGAAIKDLTLIKKEANGQGEWLLTFACDNQSELREGDEILLSDGNPITGNVVMGTITAISATQVTVWVPELIAEPRLIDKYENNSVHTRTLQNLYRWLHVEPRLRELVSGKLRPRFNSETIRQARADFNDEQNLAVERALLAEDYLLIQGPPGTGKTSVIAEIVKQLCSQGQRVLLAAFTNQAVDNMLKRLDSEGFHDYLRLGHERSVSSDIQQHLLKSVFADGMISRSETSLQTPEALTPTRDVTTLPIRPMGNVVTSLVGVRSPTVRELLRNAPVVASTTATWSSDKYDLMARETGDGGNNGHGSSLEFDVAIIDEASQLTIPALLGAVRFAKRFILVGDEQQLPPLVLSKEAAEQGLSDSLFSYLKRLDEDYVKQQTDSGSEEQCKSACVSLKTQYRMNKWIGNFASKVFYDGKLVAAPEIANRVLEWSAAGREMAVATKPLEHAGVIQALQPAYPLVFVDVRNTSDHALPKTNDAEARAVRDIVKGLLICGIQPCDIGIIAPYRAQVATIRRHLFSDDAANGWQALPTDTAMSIDTVDRFQGGERMVIIMSFATAQTPQAGNPLRDFLTNPNRLNVALTRAQRKLIVVGCAPALRELPYFQRLLAYCESMKTIFAYI
jgi:DNA replication ATP-dependent helicase Dna2